MGNRKNLLAILISVMLGSLFLVFWPQTSITQSGQASVEWLQAEAVDTAQDFARVYGPKAFQFPRDFGPHEDYQTEWWYYTGNLATEEGREFGYQLTFFRRGLEAGEAMAEGSDWRTNQIYFSHFTLSDVRANRFYPHERFSRDAIDLSGAQFSPYRVWLENWSAEEIEPGKVRLRADAGDVALDLALTETLPPVPQGDQGYSVKGPEAGNASYYYSIVQQQTQGTVTVQDKTFAVKGLTWEDHEYSTSALSAGTVGWDWFSLQLDDGSALMLYGLREAEGRFTDLSSGTFITADGKAQSIGAAEWQMTVLETWHSPTSQVDYPAKWHIEVPKLGLVLEGQPMMPNQELNLSTTYWEGAVRFLGQVKDRPVQAKGYVEMTGYASSLGTVL